MWLSHRPHHKLCHTLHHAFLHLWNKKKKGKSVPTEIVHSPQCLLSPRCIISPHTPHMSLAAATLLKKKVSQSFTLKTITHHLVQAHCAIIISHFRTNNDNALGCGQTQMTGMEAMLEQGIPVHLWKLVGSNEMHWDPHEFTLILTQLILAVHCLHLSVLYKILKVSSTVTHCRLAIQVELFNGILKSSPIDSHSSSLG